MSAELEALIAALRTLNPELKARVAQGIWNDADYHTAFSKLPLKIDELVAVLCSLNADQKEQLSQAIWTDAEYKATFNKLLISDLQSLQAGTEKQTRQPPHLPIEAPTGNPPAPRPKAPFSTKQALKPPDSDPSPKVAPVSAHSVIDLDPGFDELALRDKGRVAMEAYLKQEGIEKYSTHPNSKRWIRHFPGNNWTCILYSAEGTAKANSWFFGTSESILRDKLAENSMSAIVFLCRISPDKVAVRELEANRLSGIISALSKANEQMKFNVRKEDNGYYYLVHKKGRERLA